MTIGAGGMTLVAPGTDQIGHVGVEAAVGTEGTTWPHGLHFREEDIGA